MSLEQAVADNTAAINALIAKLNGITLVAGAPTTLRPAVTVNVSTKQPDAPAATQPVQQATPAAITYDTLKNAFLALIRQLGSAEAAKTAVLTPLGLSDLKSNENKPDLFPAILEKITQAKAAV